MQPVIVTTSCEKKKDAENIAVLVLKKRLAACVQISSPVTSSYWWKDKIVTDKEYLVNMKSDNALFERLAEVIRKVHPYEIPEIVATELIAVDKAYMRWLSGELVRSS